MCAMRAAALLPAPRGSVLEFGNQTWAADSVMPGMASTRSFYEKIGFNRYLAIDVNDRLDAVALDLNEDLLARYDFEEQFNLVTNNGTSEHIFDQRMVFENAHNVCRLGGVMLHILPFTPWLNHGFFNYNPIVFRDIAAANGYEWLFALIGDRTGVQRQIEKEDFEWSFQEKRPAKLAEVLAGGGWKRPDVFFVACWRKTIDADFRIPLQSKYKASIADKDIAETYR